MWAGQLFLSLFCFHFRRWRLICCKCRLLIERPVTYAISKRVIETVLNSLTSVYYKIRLCVTFEVQMNLIKQNKNFFTQHTATMLTELHNAP